MSVKDPDGGCNVVILDPAAFDERTPMPGKTWHVRFESGKLSVLAALTSNERYAFSAASFGIAEPATPLEEAGTPAGAGPTALSEIAKR